MIYKGLKSGGILVDDVPNRNWHDPDTGAKITALEIEYDEMEKRMAEGKNCKVSVESPCLKSPLMMQMLLACYWAKWNGADVHDYVSKKQWNSDAGLRIGRALGKRDLAFGCKTTEKGDAFVRKMAQTSVDEPFCCVSSEMWSIDYSLKNWREIVGPEWAEPIEPMKEYNKPKWSDWVKWTGDRRPVKKMQLVEVETETNDVFEVEAAYLDWSQEVYDKILRYSVKL